MRAVTIIKFFGCWFCIIAAAVLILVSHQPYGLPIVLATLAIPFALAPTSW